MSRNLVLLIGVCFAFAWLVTSGASKIERLSEIREADATGETPPPKTQEAVADSGDQLMIRAGQGGHFFVTAYVNGREIDFLVDTGASTVALSREDAAALGFHPHNLDFSHVYRTANGIARAAPVTLNEIMIEHLSVYDVDAAVMEGEMGHSLLGMSFLNRLSGYQVRADTLYLYW